MNFDDYCSDVYADAMDIIRDSYADYDNWDKLQEDLFLDVTGNANGSYYCNYYNAMEAVQDIIWDESYSRSYGSLPTDKGPEVCDVIVRCNALGEMAAELKEEFEYFKMKELGDKAVEKAFEIIASDEDYKRSYWDDEFKIATIIKDDPCFGSVTVYYTPKLEVYRISPFDAGEECVDVDCTFEPEVDAQDIVDAVWELME